MGIRKFLLPLFLFIAMLSLLINPVLGFFIAILFLIWCYKNLVEPIIEIERKIKSFFVLKEVGFNNIASLRTERGIDKILFSYGNLQKQLEESELKFKSLLDSLPIPTLLLDTSGRIKYYNDKFFSCFSKTGVLIQTDERNQRETFYWEIIREFALIELIKSALTEQKKNRFSKKVEIGGKNFSVVISRVGDEIFFIFEDISLAQELREIKRELVENISHELKTPLSNVKGYIETIEDELKKIKVKSKQIKEIIPFFEPLRRNTDRLIRIVNDLLILSEVEYGVKLEEEKIDFKKILSGILRMQEKSLKNKKLSVEINISDNLPEFKADPFRIEQMLFNLIDNAIRYTDKGSITIKIYPEKNQTENAKCIKIVVEDTGIGIPKEHIPRIFERFYVVDKSRSRQTGGTGLGLSIVKHIVLMYGGKINVESKVGVGTKFEITFPIIK